MEIFKITFRISLMGPSQLIPVIDDELQQTTWLWKQKKKMWESPSIKKLYWFIKARKYVPLLRREKKLLLQNSSPILL